MIKHDNLSSWESLYMIETLHCGNLLIRPNQSSICGDVFRYTRPLLLSQNAHWEKAAYKYLAIRSDIVDVHTTSTVFDSYYTDISTGNLDRIHRTFSYGGSMIQTEYQENHF